MKIVFAVSASAEVKSLGEWSQVGSGRVFRLIEASDIAAMYKSTIAWTDLGTIETYPVMEVESVMAAVSGK